MNDFHFFEKLGEGAFAVVFKVYSKKRQKYFAIKCLKKKYRVVDEVKNLPELTTLQLLQGHPNIIRLEDALYDRCNGSVHLLLELCDINLAELIQDNGSPFEERVALTITYQILKAVAFMHSKGLFHRDIKPENCMVNRDTLDVKLVDFGSTSVDNSREVFTEYISTRWYRAPECIMTSGSYGMEIDEWAVGCILFEVLTRQPLFPGENELDQLAKIHSLLGTPSDELMKKFIGNPNRELDYHFKFKPAQDLEKLLPNKSMATVDLLKKLLTYDPSKRMKAVDALNHQAFAFLRTAEKKWLVSEKDVSFPIFALTEFAAQMKKNYQARPSLPPRSGQVSENLSMTISKVSIGRPMEEKRAPVQKLQDNAKLTESRVMAAKRIKAYNQKMLAEKKQADSGGNTKGMGLEFKFRKPQMTVQKPVAKLKKGLVAQSFCV